MNATLRRHSPLAMTWQAIAVAIALLAPVSARADDDESLVPDAPAADALMTKVTAATGAEPATERGSFSFTRSGLSGRIVELRSGDDFIRTTTFGPFVNSEGRYRGRSWHQTENGQTVIALSARGQEAKEKLTTKVERIRVPVDGYLISILNAAGYGSKEYIDASTWLVVRRDRVRASGTTTTIYDDFRRVGGHAQPFHYIIRDGNPQDDAEYRVEDDVVAPVSDTELAIPPSKRELVSFPAGVTLVKLPALEDRHQFIVRVEINGRGLDLLLDTGASTTTLDEGVARELGLEPIGSATNTEAAQPFESARAIVPEMKIGELMMRNVVVMTHPHFGTDRPGYYKVVGLLGFDFLDAVALEIDYAAGSLTAIAPHSFVPPSDAATVPLEVRLGIQCPMLDVTVNGALGERFILDTGLSGGVMLFDYFVRRYPSALRQTQIADVHYSGAGGTFDTRPLRLDEVRIGTLTLTNVPAVEVTTRAAYGGNYDGLIGADVLANYTIFTDYSNSKLYLRPRLAAESVKK